MSGMLLKVRAVHFRSRGSADIVGAHVCLPDLQFVIILYARFLKEERRHTDRVYMISTTFFVTSFL